MNRFLLAALLPLAFAPLPAAHATTGKPGAAETAERATLRAELQRALTAKGLNKTGVDRVLANLDRLDMAELRDLAGFAGEAASGAERVLPGSGTNVRDRAGELTGRSGITTGSGPASQRGIDRAMTPGVRDTRGHVSSCQACPDAPKETSVMGDKQRNGGDMARPEGSGPAEPRRVANGNGEVIVIQPDGSASILRLSTGKFEYVDSEHRLVDSKGNAKEPLPDDQGASGGFTAADVKRVAALIGRYSQPAGNDEGGTGGPVDAGRANPTGSRGLYTDAQLGAGYVSRADLQEILRVAFEKLRGPQAR